MVGEKGPGEKGNVAANGWEDVDENGIKRQPEADSGQQSEADDVGQPEAGADAQQPEAGDGQQQPEATSADDAENGDAGNETEKNREKILNEIYDHYTKDIFDAAEAANIDLVSCVEVKKWDEAKLSTLLGKMRELEKAEADKTVAGKPAGSTDAGAVETGASDDETTSEAAGTDSDGHDSAVGVVAGAAAGGAAGAVAGAISDARDGATAESDSDDSEEGEENDGDDSDDGGAGTERAASKERKKPSRGVLKKVAVGALLVASLVGMFGAGYKFGNNKNIGDQTSGTPQTQEQTVDGVEQNEGKEVIDDMGYRGVYASEDGKTYNSEKVRKYNFAPESMLANAGEQNPDKAKAAVLAIARQPESLAAYYSLLPQELQIDQLKGKSGTEIEQMIESNSDLYAQTQESFKEAIDNSEVKDVTLKGEYQNFYMRSALKGDGDTIGHENTSLVQCTTQEDGSREATQYIFDGKDGEVAGDLLVNDECGNGEKAEGSNSPAFNGVPEITSDENTPVQTETPPAQTDTPAETDTPAQPGTPAQTDTPAETDTPPAQSETSTGDQAKKGSELVSGMDPDHLVDDNTNLDGEGLTSKPTTGDSSTVITADPAQAPASGTQIGDQGNNGESGDGSKRNVEEVITESDQSKAGDVNRTDADAAAKKEAAAAAEVQSDANAEAQAAQKQAEQNATSTDASAANALVAEQAGN